MDTSKKTGDFSNGLHVVVLVYNFSTFFIEIKKGMQFFWGKVLSHKIHGNTKFKGILIWLLHTVSSCLFTLCKV